MDIHLDRCLRDFEVVAIGFYIKEDRDDDCKEEEDEDDEEPHTPGVCTGCV